MNGQRVDELVPHYDRGPRRGGRSGQIIGPSHLPTLSQHPRHGFSLQIPQTFADLHDAVDDALPQIGASLLPSPKYGPGQVALSSAQFDDCHRRAGASARLGGRAGLRPSAHRRRDRRRGDQRGVDQIGDQPADRPAKRRREVGRGAEVAPAAEERAAAPADPSVVAVSGMGQGQFHEPGERDPPTFGRYLPGDARRHRWCPG